MKRLLLLFVTFAMSFVPLFSAFAGVSSEYGQYRNQRFDFSIPYPKTILFPQGESDNGDGQVFLSRDSTIRLIAYGGFASEQSIRERYADALSEARIRSDSTVITYKPQKKNWFVISGIDNESGIIFYQKEFLVNGVFKRFIITYPESKKKSLDKIITKISRGFLPR